MTFDSEKISIKANEDPESVSFKITCSVNEHLVPKKYLRTSWHELCKKNCGGHGKADCNSYVLETDDHKVFSQAKYKLLCMAEVIEKTNPHVLRNINVVSDYLMMDNSLNYD